MNFDICSRKLAMVEIEGFDLKDFIADCKRIWDGAARPVDFTASKLALRTLVVNTILAEREFEFASAIVWNLFFVSRHGLDFVVSRRLARFVMITPVIAAERIEIEAVVSDCRKLTPAAIAFVLANPKIDEFVPRAGDFEKLADAL
jgi:hypothetical protein